VLADLCVGQHGLCAVGAFLFRGGGRIGSIRSAALRALKKYQRADEGDDTHWRCSAGPSTGDSRAGAVSHTGWSDRPDHKVGLFRSFDRRWIIPGKRLIPDVHHYNGRGGRAYPLWQNAAATVANIRAGSLLGRDRLGSDREAWQRVQLGEAKARLSRQMKASRSHPRQGPVDAVLPGKG
jgi:hypothetical protein